MNSAASEIHFLPRKSFADRCQNRRRIGQIDLGEIARADGRLVAVDGADRFVGRFVGRIVDVRNPDIVDIAGGARVKERGIAGGARAVETRFRKFEFAALSKNGAAGFGRTALRKARFLNAKAGARQRSKAKGNAAAVRGRMTAIEKTGNKSECAGFGDRLGGSEGLGGITLRFNQNRGDEEAIESRERGSG